MVDWLADAVTGAKLDKQDLHREMTVVRNEMERGESNPHAVLGQLVRATPYRFHAYGHDPIGAHNDVEHVAIESLRTFYHRFYRPDNAVLVVGGVFDEVRVLQRVEQAFGTIPKASTPLPADHWREPVQEGERSVVL